VIITQESWKASFQPLADWKTKKGIPATIVTTSWIYTTYNGASNQDKIRAFIKDAHDTWGATFILLGGDGSKVPYHMNYKFIDTVWPDPLPNDAYYADYNDDYICDVNLGRIPVTTTTQITTSITKIITYEKIRHSPIMPPPPTSVDLIFVKKIAVKERM